jgi:hypothetical protein
MRRLILVLLVTVFLLPAPANAASWHSFTSKSLGFALRYPPGWHAVPSATLTGQQVVFSYQARQLYAVTVSVLNLTPGSSPQKTLQRFLSYEKRASGTQYSAMHWSSATFAGKKAEAGISAPPTEGGVTISQGIYVVGGKRHVYAVALTAYAKRPLARLSQFPAVYRQILATWRFL